jgi:HSP20 family protein
VDILECETSYELTAELPGVDQEGISVKSFNGCLHISGSKQAPRITSKAHLHLAERRYGDFERVFEIPKGTDSEGIEVTLSRGVLTVILPKKSDAILPAKNISIHSC